MPVRKIKKKRCSWSGDDPIYIQYHDEEWGVPIFDDKRIFEFLLLETFQAGLSWISILKKRENFREAFSNFDSKKIANYSDEKLETLKKNPGIIRNRLKINATKTNAIAFIEVQKEFGTFSKYLWGFVEGTPIKNNFNSTSELPANTPLSERISKDLKRRGFKFVGATIIYSYMQAMGIVNDHTTNCFRHDEV